MYVDYDFYRNVLGRTAIPEEQFATAEKEAEAHISYFTYINGDIFAKESDRVKLAVCSAAEVIYNYTKNHTDQKCCYTLPKILFC